MPAILSRLRRSAPPDVLRLVVTTIALAPVAYALALWGIPLLCLAIQQGGLIVGGLL